MKFFFGRKYSYRVFIRGGGDFKIQADDLDLNWNDDNGQITSFKFTRPKGDVPAYINPLDIVTITQLT